MKENAKDESRTIFQDFLIHVVVAQYTENKMYTRFNIYKIAELLFNSFLTNITDYISL